MYSLLSVTCVALDVLCALADVCASEMQFSLVCLGVIIQKMLQLLQHGVSHHKRKRIHFLAMQPQLAQVSDGQARGHVQ